MANTRLTRRQVLALGLGRCCIAESIYWRRESDGRHPA